VISDLIFENFPQNNEYHEDIDIIDNN